MALAERASSLDDDFDMSLDELIEISRNLRSERQQVMKTTIILGTEALTTDALEDECMSFGFKCEPCDGKLFKDARALLDHCHDKHPQQKQAQAGSDTDTICPECGKVLKNKEGLGDHAKDKHALPSKRKRLASGRSGRDVAVRTLRFETVPPKQKHAKVHESRICDNCQNHGHLWTQCPLPVQCNCCGSLAHLKNDCPHTAKACSACHYTGHLRIKCQHVSWAS
jgi:hypothetical protein